MNPLALRILILVLSFGSVFLFVEHALRFIRSRQSSAGAINFRLKMIAEGRDREQIMVRLRKAGANGLGFLPGFLQPIAQGLENLVLAARVTLSVRQVLFLMVAGAGLIFSIFLLGVAYTGLGITLGVVELGLTVSACAGVVLPLMVLSRRAQKLRRRVQEQFPVALDIFVRGLRSGHPISAALSLLSKEMEDPLGSEFGLIVDEIGYGQDLQTALQDFATRWDVEDIHMFVVCLSVQNETGGNLAEILDNLSKVIRERASMFMKVRALSSEGRMTARILTVLPVLTFLSMFAVNPAFYLEYARTPAFVIGFSSLIGLYLIGMLWINKLVNLNV